MAHNHHHHNHFEGTADLGKIYILSIVSNVLFVGFEFFMGFRSDSIGLISDAGHNLSDVLSLIIALVATVLLQRADNRHRKASAVLSLINAILLIVAVAVIFYEGFRNLSSPATVDGFSVSWTAGVGILVNGLTTLLLRRGGKNDINARGAFLHMLADTLVSLAVLVSGVIIFYTSWSIIDPILGIVVAFVILIPTLDLTKASIHHLKSEFEG